MFASVNSAHAQWAAIEGTGFATTTNWHGIDVPFGESVTATAGWVPANEPTGGPPHTPILTVTFVWHYPDDYLPDPGGVAWSDTVPILGPFTVTGDAGDLPPNVPQEIEDWYTDPANKDLVWWYAQDTRVPNAFGDWGVQAIFIDEVYTHQGELETFRVIRSTSGNVVPEVPFGTIAILAGWLGVLGIFALRRKHIPA